MRLLVAYRGIPQSPGWATGDSIVRAARMLGHDVATHGVYYQTTTPLPDHVSPDFKPDLVIHLECNDDGPQYDLRRHKARRVYWEFDTAMHVDWTRNFLDVMKPDYVCMANAALALEFGAGYLPYAIDPALFGPRLGLLPRAGAACIGSPFGPRVEFCRAAGVELRSGIYREDYVEALAHLAVSVHHHASGGAGLIVARPWETMACGTCLLAEDDPTLRLHFVPGIHYVPFTSAEECRDLLALLLEHAEEREHIAAAGFTLVHREHTYVHRVATIIRECT